LNPQIEDSVEGVPHRDYRNEGVGNTDVPKYTLIHGSDTTTATALLEPQ
jgi:hypothetical protein